MASKAKLGLVGSNERTINLESNQSEESKEAKCQKLSIFPFEDLPDEIILNVLSFLDIKDLLRCSQTSKRIRMISNDESLWLKINISRKRVPAAFLQKILINGCKYLSLHDAVLEGNLTLKNASQLRYFTLNAG